MKTHSEQSNFIRQHERRSFEKSSHFAELAVDQSTTQQVKLETQLNTEVVCHATCLDLTAGIYHYFKLFLVCGFFGLDVEVKTSTSKHFFGLQHASQKKKQQKQITVLYRISFSLPGIVVER